MLRKKLRQKEKNLKRRRFDIIYIIYIYECLYKIVCNIKLF